MMPPGMQFVKRLRRTANATIRALTRRGAAIDDHRIDICGALPSGKVGVSQS